MQFWIGILISSLALSPVTAAPIPSSVLSVDQELWDAVNDIQLRRLTRGYGTSGTNALALASLAVVARQIGKKTLKSGQASPAVLLAVSVGNLTALVFTLGAGWWAGTGILAATLNDFTRFKAGQRAFWRVELDAHVESTFKQIRQITRLSIPDQYRLAAYDPSLRQFIIQFDQWLREGVGHGIAPPVAPVGAIRLN